MGDKLISYRCRAVCAQRVLLSLCASWRRSGSGLGAGRFQAPATRSPKEGLRIPPGPISPPTSGSFPPPAQLTAGQRLPLLGPRSQWEPRRRGGGSAGRRGAVPPALRRGRLQSPSPAPGRACSGEPQIVMPWRTLPSAAPRSGCPLTRGALRGSETLDQQAALASPGSFLAVPCPTCSPHLRNQYLQGKGQASLQRAFWVILPLAKVCEAQF